MSAGEIIILTERAEQEIRTIFEREQPAEGTGLRLGVVGGGCSGLSYEMEFSETRSNDSVLPYQGFQVLLDPKSAIYLKDVILDFEDGLQGKGFVFKNPNATNTCGCGDSFSV
ncbi:MAG: iron-sulfur cluster assembly accessory protein [Thermoanaerobaculales bacterium]|jgi:iron-sulfur cluster assembly protein|nr:iron-sulfur cluster assembly accessory protein [Thermoanaerobaculales bacterium]